MLKNSVLFKKLSLCVAVTSIFFGSHLSIQAAEDTAWTEIFNGRDFDGWKAKFANVQYPANPDSTFRIIDGSLAAYSHLPFDQVSFGHLFYLKQKFSWFYVRMEYKFTTDDRMQGFPTWDQQNSGFMFHCPHPETMTFEQEFPNSLEMQILGPKSPLGDSKGNSMNVCTPGTYVAINGQFTQDHCINAIPHDLTKSEWNEVSAFVFGDSLVKQMVGQDTVLRYGKLRYDAVSPATEGLAAKEGYVAFQAEGAPVLFRKIKMLNLVGCMDKTSPNYKSYYRKNDAVDCAKPVAVKNVQGKRSKQTQWQRGQLIPYSPSYWLGRKSGLNPS